jgi:hypothetical protein
MTETDSTARDAVTTMVDGLRRLRMAPDVEHAETTLRVGTWGQWRTHFDDGAPVPTITAPAGVMPAAVGADALVLYGTIETVIDHPELLTEVRYWWACHRRALGDSSYVADSSFARQLDAARHVLAVHGAAS